MAIESFGLEKAWTRRLEKAWTRLGPALSHAINVEKLAKVLDWITRDSNPWKVCKSVHDAYLCQLMIDDQAAAKYIPHLRLASADGTWRKSAELCAGAHGVVKANLLDAGQESILGNLVCRECAPTEAAEMSESGNLSEDEFQQYQNTVCDDLSGYFDSWDPSLVPIQMIGAVLALLGPAVRKIANEFLDPHSFEWFVKQLPPWSTLEQTERMGGISVSEALDRIKVGMEVPKSDEVKVLNLLNEYIQVPLDETPNTLLAGNLKWVGENGVLISLRRIDPDQFQPDKLVNLLHATAERLYRDLYKQNDTNFGGIWEELERSDQLAIEIARHLILEHIPFYFRQLSVKYETIKKQLAECDRWRYRIREVEADGRHEAKSERNEWCKSLSNLADSIDRNPDEQMAIVQAIKGKLEHYQYDLSSIPFELFQNADDAAIELGQVPVAAQRFVVEEREDGIGFLHWGRRINAPGCDEFNGDGRDYRSDLEKMLILSATDKSVDESVTGKFGLGFKAVLLACEQPRIISGRLAIRVVAGMLPQPWEDATEGRQRLNKFSGGSKLPGTLVDLPDVDADLRERLLKRFQRISGILCVFGRTIRTIEHHVGVALPTVSCWEPSEICPRVEIGDLNLQGDWGIRTRALCVRTENGSLLMAMDPHGFRKMPDCVPSLWVTAPTRESSTVGFAVNGDFDLDAGRGRLAGNPDNNLKKARRIGEQVGADLGALLELSHNDWCSVRSALGLTADLEVMDFWESIWLGLTKGLMIPHRRDGENLAREVAMTVLARLCDRRHAIPNGLNAPLRGFTDASEIKYELCGILLGEKAGAVLGAWKRFTNCYPGNRCVSEQIAKILKEAVSRNL